MHFLKYHLYTQMEVCLENPVLLEQDTLWDTIDPAKADELLDKFVLKWGALDEGNDAIPEGA